MRGRVRAEATLRLRELAPAGDATPGCARVMPRDDGVHEALEEVPLGRLGRAPCLLERLVRREPAFVRDEREASLEGGVDGVGRHARTLTERRFHASSRGTLGPVATILVAGVDLFFRGKLDALLGSQHKLVTTESVDDPDLVIVDIARVDPDGVAEEYPDIPILGFTNHTDTAGLRAAQAAGFDRVVVRSALAERAPEIVEELVA